MTTFSLLKLTTCWTLFSSILQSLPSTSWHDQLGNPNALVEIAYSKASFHFYKEILFHKENVFKFKKYFQLKPYSRKTIQGKKIQFLIEKESLLEVR